MVDYMKRYSKASLVLSLCLIILSLFLIFKPDISLTVMFIILGIFLLVIGIMHTVSYFSSSKEFKALSFELVEGIVYSIIGLVVIFNPNIIKAFLPIIIGSWMIIGSIIKFQISLNLKSADENNWIIILVLSLVTLTLGIVMIINPFATLSTLTVICGVMLLISEIINVFDSISIIKTLN